ncbi:NACHT and WD repeat domain-containing protein 2-like [Patella vulgata]|uniref:NACHT and WD repeat domain-containing protein 2-like n=1 Tax=Patella vulgata TaxID=6465 RepID=UPI0024A9C561|nr:NACHT and WD repeat domain-containing protein 2-like [Patella vulgata]
MKASGRCETFVGREDELAVIQKYLLSSESSQPLVVFGPSGSGKTSLLAKGAILANSIRGLHEQANPAVIVRFLGTTPDSSSIQQLLYSVCHQLAFVANRNRSDVPEDFLSLKVYFRNLVLEGDFRGRVLIVLDALNQLSTNQNAHKLDWLPARHARNVKIIVSTIPFKFKILDRLMNRIQDNFIHTQPLPTKDCEDIVKILLDRSQRKVTYEQWKTIRKSFQSCTLPLFVTLTFEEAKRWHSYDQSHENVLTTTVESCIHTLFERLEKKHGKMFVAKALSYITAARDGLSESELEDILSLDDEVLNSLFVMWLPPIRRLPPSLLSRLQLDIGNFLLERDADGTVVLSWFHQQFVNVALNIY